MARIELPDGGPAWLPAKCNVGGAYEAVVARLYDIFARDFKGTYPRFNGLTVFWDTNIIEGRTLEEGFWHLVSRNSEIALRRCLDDYRAERLPWCRPIITTPENQDLLVWRYYHGSRIRVYLWLQEHDYVVVLEDRKKNYFLKTAHHLDGKQRREDMAQRYRNRIRD